MILIENGINLIMSRSKNTRRLSGIRFGQRHRQRGKSDEELLISIQNYLRTRWHLDFKREWYVGFNKETGRTEAILDSVSRQKVNRFQWRNPDLLCITKRNGLVIIEVDGAVHDRRISKTESRNENYERAGIKFIILSLSDIKERGTTIEEDLDCKMKKLGF